MNLRLKVRTALSLGLRNLWRVLIYRVMVKLGLSGAQRTRTELPQAPYFSPHTFPQRMVTSSEWGDTARYFGWQNVSVNNLCPDWMLNPFNGVRIEQANRPWWKIPDFDPHVGDIKCVWEASRFGWSVAMAQRAAAGDHSEINRLNEWLHDWCLHNPAYRGSNWKCGQEASIRVMHLAVAAILLDQHRQPLPSLLELVRAHLSRIAPTVRYAMAQDNNHSTSEAAALFVGGTWLDIIAGDPVGRKWAITGRKVLEKQIARLVAADGSFSQYSVNYHRVLLDTISIVEVWRRKFELPAFSVLYLRHARAAASWLRDFTDTISGDAPSLGANDGAKLIPLTNADYRDFRPSVQLANMLFAGARAIRDAGEWDLSADWLRIKKPSENLPESVSRIFENGGYAVLRRRGASAFFRFPRFRFRPSHADALHLDFWVGGQCLLRDSGSFSYHCDPPWVTYFPGTAAHNTVQFDRRDQMPRVSRFLFGDWLKTDTLTQIETSTATTSCAAAYRDYQGAYHFRRVSLGDTQLTVEDKISGFRESAVLRWRMQPSNWVMCADGVSNGKVAIRVRSSAPIHRFEIVEGWESLYYMQRTALPVLEVEVHAATTLTTEIEWTGDGVDIEAT